MGITSIILFILSTLLFGINVGNHRKNDSAWKDERIEAQDLYIKALEKNIELRKQREDSLTHINE